MSRDAAPADGLHVNRVGRRAGLAERPARLPRSGSAVRRGGRAGVEGALLVTALLLGGAGVARGAGRGFGLDALAPHISENTLNYHYGKHHQAYVNKLNDMIKGTDFEGDSLIEIVKNTAGEKSRQGMFNTAAQVWNHTFY